VSINVWVVKFGQHVFQLADGHDVEAILAGPIHSQLATSKPKRTFLNIHFIHSVVTHRFVNSSELHITVVILQLNYMLFF